MKKYIAYVLEETLPINESAKICTTPLLRALKYKCKWLPKFKNISGTTFKLFSETKWLIFFICKVFITNFNKIIEITFTVFRCLLLASLNINGIIFMSYGYTFISSFDNVTHYDLLTRQKEKNMFFIRLTMEFIPKYIAYWCQVNIH